MSGDLEMTRVEWSRLRASRAELDLKQCLYSYWNWLLKLNVLMASNLFNTVETFVKTTKTFVNTVKTLQILN